MSVCLDRDKAIKVLDGATKLVKKGWTKDAYARDANDTPVMIGDDKACKFCAQGAVIRSGYRNGMNTEEIIRLESVIVSMIGKPIQNYNDLVAESVDDIVSMFDRAKGIV